MNHITAGIGVVKNPFDYQKPSDEGIKTIEAIRSAYKVVYAHLQTLPITREMAVAKTKLEESAMWATKSIVFN